MADIEDSENVLDHQFYIEALEGVCAPIKEDLYSSMLNAESEFNILASRYADSQDLTAKELLRQLKDRIELLKESLNGTGIGSFYKKIIFTRKILHKLDEDFLLLKDRDELLDEVSRILNYLEMVDLPKEVRNTWNKKLSEVKTQLECDKHQEALESSRKTLRTVLNTINRSLDSSLLELFVVRFNNVVQLILTLILLFVLWSLVVNRPTSIFSDQFAANYVLALVIGALGGSLSSILSSNKQSLIKGNFTINMFLNVFARPVLGAATAISLLFAAKSQVLFGIIKQGEASTAHIKIEVADTNIAYMVMDLVAGFAGEKLLRPTMDQLINKLSMAASADRKLEPSKSKGK
jgi:hypothetical protein